MLEALGGQLQTLLGPGSDIGDLDSLHMGLRTLLIYAATLFIVRLGSKRFLSKASAFDVIVAIMLGSIMSRGITSAPLVPTVVAGAVLLGLHWLFAVVAYHVNWFGSLVKGHRVLLIKDGQVQEDGMRKAAITDADLAAALRMQTRQTDPAKIELAYLERSGNISVQPYASEPRTVDVTVQAGVQTVRIEL